MLFCSNEAFVRLTYPWGLSKVCHLLRVAGHSLALMGFLSRLWTFVRVKERIIGTYQVVQWLRFHTSNAGGVCLIPGRGTRSDMLCSPIKENQKWLWAHIPSESFIITSQSCFPVQRLKCRNYRSREPSLREEFILVMFSEVYLVIFLLLFVFKM